MNDIRTNEGKVPIIDKFIWACTGFLANLPWVIMGYYLLYFYTDTVKINAALAGTIMFAARIFDAFTDLLIGWCVDNLHFKWGKFRTWVRFAIPANIILWPMVWMAFNNALTLNTVIACIGYGCFGAVGCTLYYIPTSCQLGVLTKSESERASLVAWRAVAGNVASVIAVAVFMPMVNAFGGGNTGFFLAALVMLIPQVACLVGDYIISKKYELNKDGTWKKELEVQTESGEKIPLGRQFKTLLTNRPAIILVLGILFMYIVQAFRNSSAVYIFEYYFELPEMETIALTGMTIASILGALVMKPVIKFIKDSNRAFIIWTIAGAMVYVIFWILCRTMVFESARKSLQWGLLFWLYMLGGFFQGAYYNFAAVLLPMAVDYGVWKFNYNQSGFIYSLNGFTLTAGSAFGAALLGFALSGIGYSEGVALTQGLKGGLIFWGVMFPSILCFAHAGVQAFFGLNDKKYQTIVADLKRREAAADKSALGSAE